MEIIMQVIKYVVAALFGFAAYFLGGLDKLSLALVAFMAIDYVSGLLCAWTNKTISSETGFRGIVKKIVQLSVVAVAYMIESITGGGLPLRELTIMFFLANEGLSILENAASLGLPLPESLKSALIQLEGGKQSKNNEESDSEDDQPDDDSPD